MADAPIRIDVIANVSNAVSQLLGLNKNLADTATQANATSAAFKDMGASSGAAASTMAANAQLSARAAMGMSTGFKASADAARVNTMAMRETLVVARELSRGNFTRLPGSLTLLAQGVSSSGGLSAFAASLAKTLGLIKTVQNAELAEEATNATAAATAVQGAAERAAAAVTAADTELALAQAQVRVTAGTTAEAAAQVRLAAAHEAVTVAAAEATVAEEALGTASAAAGEAQAAAAAESVTTTTALGVAIGATVIAAGLLAAVFVDVKDSAEKLDPSAKQYISTLGLTRKEIKKLKDDHVTWGDVAAGTFNAVAKAAGTSSSQFKSFWTEALEETAQVGISAAQVIAAAFAGAATFTKKSGLVGAALNIVAPGTGSIYEKAHPSESPGKAVNDAVAAAKKMFGDVGTFFHVTLPKSVNDHRDGRLKKQSDEIKADRTPKKPKKGPKDRTEDQEDTFAKESAQLDAETLAARKQLLVGYDSQADFAAKEVEEQRLEKQAEIAKQLADKKITADKAKDLSLQADTLAAAKTRVISEQKLAKQAAQQVEMAEQQLQFKIDDLKFADSMATTQAERRKIENEIVDLEYQEKEAKLVAVQHQLEKNQQDAIRLNGAPSADITNQLAINQAQQNQLAVQTAQDHLAVDQKTQGPLEAWAKSVPKTADEIKQAIQGIEVDGINSLTDAITGVITGTKSLGAAFKDMAKSIISEILQMTIKMLIFKAISAVLGGGFGGGSSIVGGASGLGDTFTVGGIPGLATGGPANAGTTYLVGEKGPELFVPRQAGTVISNDNLSNMGGATTFNYSPSIVLQASGNQQSDQQTLAQLKQQQRETMNQITYHGGIPRWSRTN